MTLCFFPEDALSWSGRIKKASTYKDKRKRKTSLLKWKRKTLKKIKSTEVDGWLCRGEKAKSSAMLGHGQEITWFISWNWRTAQTGSTDTSWNEGKDGLQIEELVEVYLKFSLKLFSSCLPPLPSNPGRSLRSIYSLERV